MDIDKLFKAPALPAGGSKRKLPDQPTAEVLKRFRADVSSEDAPTVTRSVTVEDEVEEEDGFEPGAEEPYDGEDDDEGRFFGGGLNDEQNQILDIFERAGDDDEEPSAMTVPALRRLLGRFERTVAKNAEQRGKYPDDPARFIDSESELDAMIKQFLPLTSNPALYYPELVSSGTVALFANLLSHENTDIAIDVIEVLQELTDEDVGVEDDNLSDADEDEVIDKSTQTRRALAQLIDELLSHSVFELLVSNLHRLNEDEDTDRQGVFQVLGVFENLLTFMPPLAEQVGSNTTILQWLLRRMGRDEFDSNKQYASEILSILLQGTPSNIVKVAEDEGVDKLLTVLSKYRKDSPRDGEEEEFMGNTFNCMCSLLAEPECKDLFLKAEGVELMTIMMKEKSAARNRAIKVLDFALQNQTGAANCERFVEMMGLKTLFSAFMGKGEKKKKHRHLSTTFEDEEHLLGIIASLLTNLASDTPERIRLVAKFVENDYEKVDRLLELRETAENRLKTASRVIASERKDIVESGEEVDDVQEDEWYLRRLDAGLSALQTSDYILAWVYMEDDGVKAHAEQLLGRKGISLGDVRNVLREMASRIDVDIEGTDEPDEADVNAYQQKMILEGLTNFLSGA